MLDKFGGGLVRRGLWSPVDAVISSGSAASCLWLSAAGLAGNRKKIHVPRFMHRFRIATWSNRYMSNAIKLRLKKYRAMPAPILKRK